MSRTLPLFTSLAGAALLLSDSASACTCTAAVEGACGYARDAGLIFTGRAVSVKRSGEQAVYSFTVAEVFRSSAGVSGGTSVEVHTMADGASCGVHFDLNRDYLVYAGPDAGRYVTSLCRGNALVQESSAALRFLRHTGPDALSKKTPLPGAVFGFVTNRSGDASQFWTPPTWPAREVRVRAVNAEGGVSAETLTGEDGGYELYGLAPGQYRIEAESGGDFKPAPSGEAGAVTVAVGACVVRSFVRASFASLEIRITDADGEPDESSELELVPTGPQPAAPLPGSPSELSNGDGKDGLFEFRVPPGRYRLKIRELGYPDPHVYPGEVTLRDTAPAARLSYRLPRRPTQTIQARVSDLDGRPVAGLKIRLRGNAADGAAVWGDVLTPANGRVQFDEIAPGTYQLTAEQPGCPVTVPAQAGAKTEIRIVVPVRNGLCIQN